MAVQVPISIPRLRVGAELGHGANSVVYRAELDGSPCAFKVPRTKGTWTKWVYREAVALARVRDPALPAVLEVGEVDGLPYLAMELVEGETLAERLQRGPLPEAEALSIALTVLRALSRVHAAGLVHRDVKPKNLMVTADGRVTLVDFGFATPIERGAESEDAELAGTPAYAAPEQLRVPARIDGRADLFAVGMVLFECLTTKLPRLAEPLSLPSPEAEGRLGVVVRGLLAIEPENRYPSARAVISDLERAQAGRPPLGPRAYAVPTTTTPLIGRELEVARLAERFGGVANGGAVVFLRGLRGAGKSRLVAAAHEAWHEGGRVRTLATSCREGDPPWSALKRLFDAFVEATERAPSPDRLAMVDALSRAAEGHLGALAALVNRRIGALIGVKSETAMPPSISEGLAELLIRLVRRVGPVLVTVDDLQWIDPPSREVFAKVAHRVQEAPLVLLLASRVDGAGDVPVERFRASELPRAEVIDLGPMVGTDIAGIVAAYLGSTEVEPEATERVAALSDGTPLGILAVLSAMLDTGALRPQRGSWQLDRDRAERVALPTGAMALLGRRVGELPPATRKVLDQASVLGVVFEDALLAAVLGMAESDVGFALADGRRAGVLVPDGTERHRFVHDGIREIVLARLNEVAARAAHQRAAEVLMRQPRPSVEILFAMADHYQSGELDAAPARGYAAARRAATAALDLYDNENALRFLGFAAGAAERAGIQLDCDYHRAVGETQLRMGSLTSSAASFERALSLAATSRERAEILGRMAWVHQTAAEPERAWACLADAFEAVEARMPVESARSAGATIGQLVRWTGLSLSVLPRAVVGGRHRAEDIPLLCDLHYQNARLGMEYGKPARFVQSTIQAMDLSASLGPSRAHARTLAMRGFVMTALGGRRIGANDLVAARRMADEIGDAATAAFAVQLQLMAATVSGEVDRAVELQRELVDERAHWMELHEYCLTIANADVVDSMRGKLRESLGWLDRVVVRVQRSGRSIAAFDDVLVHRVRAARVTAGLPPEIAARAPARGAPTRGFFRTLAWGPKVRCFVESGDLGAEFDALVREFEGEKLDPRTTHLAVGEYYMAIVQARVHQCLRATTEGRPAAIAALRRATEDLGHAARIPILKAHHILAEAYVAFFSGKLDDALDIAAQAERAARKDDCPIILYGAARLRAHALVAMGRRDAAIDEARIAETIAVQHGAVCRARWIREEIGLPTPQAVEVGSEATSQRSEAGGTRYLSALVQVARAGLKDLRLTPQAIAILDELLRDADASRGFLWLPVDPGRAAFGAIGRTRAGESIEDVGGKLEGLFRSVMEAQAEWPPDDDGRGSVRASAGWLPGLDPRRTLVLPLMLADRAVGALLLSRTADQPAFSFGIRRVLSMLVHQVALALELSRVFEERDRLQRSLQQAQKMEAVGRLAASVAHDMNNMLQVTQSSLERLRAAKPDAEIEEDVRLLSEGTAKAQGLVRQLLTFSRVRSASRERMHLHEIILRNESLMRTLLGKSATLELRLEAAGPWVHVDPTLFEQSLFNLVINARDAIGDRDGTLTIATETVRIQESAPGGPGPGEHVLLTVRDTGSGMSEDVAARVFEPFFTTKGEGSGTGLGLSTVYGFVQNSGGHIDLTSAPGKGTTFSIHLPTQTHARPAPSPSRRTSVLVVDDEEIVANSLRRVLEAAGHSVLVALNATDALAVARKHEPDIALALVDVRLADTTGPQLVQKLWELEVPRKVIYMSGHLPEDVLRELGDAPVVDKPFSSSELLRRIELMKNS